MKMNIAIVNFNIVSLLFTRYFCLIVLFNIYVEYDRDIEETSIIIEINNLLRFFINVITKYL